jgi:plastocyanin
MPINNEGRLLLSEVLSRQVDTDWPVANTNFDLFVQDLIASGNLIANGLIIRNIEVSDNILTGNITAATITANTLTLDIITANIFVGIDTDQVTEGSNLYFTNTRAILSVFPATTQLVISTPVFNYNIDQYSGDNPEIYVTAGETISFELLHSSSHPFNIRVSNGGSAYNTGLTHVDTDGTISTGSAAQGKYTGKLFWKIPYDLAGNTYVYQCTNHSSMVGNIVIQGSVLSTITNKDLTLNNLTVNGDLTVQGNTTTLNTATLVIEDKNIVLANGAADAATADGAGITIYGADANITYRESGDKFEINKNVFVMGDLDVTGNLSGNGLVIRGIEVSDAVLSGNVAAVGGISGNTIAVDSITSNTWNNLYTANVIETSGNLYFTVQRARDSFSAGQNITIVEGAISALTQVTVTNDNTVIETLANTLTYNMGRVISDARNVLVIVEGLIQIPTVDYTVAGPNLIFLDQPPPGANIEVRFFGIEGSAGPAPTLISVVNSFVGSGNVEYSLSIVPPGKDYVSVVIDGVSQQAESYGLSGSILTFTDAPTVGANIDVRILSGQAARPFSTRTFVGDGANVNFTVSPGYSADNILVFENGVAQVPGTDYTYDDGTLIFTIAPASNVDIQVRELGTSGPNLLSTIRGLDQITGNLVPDVDGFRSLGAPDKRFKDLYLTGNTIVLGDIALSSSEGILQIAPVVAGNVITANSAPTSFTAGDNITIEANGRISSTGATTGKAIAMAIVFGG